MKCVERPTSPFFPRTRTPPTFFWCTPPHTPLLLREASSTPAYTQTKQQGHEVKGCCSARVSSARYWVYAHFENVNQGCAA